MPRVVWLSDLHFNFVPLPTVETFADEIRTHAPDAVLISGDIGESASVAAYLQILEILLQVPIYFVLGNHDFYRGSIANVRQQAEVLTHDSHYLRWLPRMGVIELCASTALLGHDGWGDGRLGDFMNSDVMMNDYRMIEELRVPSKPLLRQKLMFLGDETAAYFREWLPRACRSHRNIIVLTHVPPFRDSCWHEGQLSDDNFLPHFTCGAAGDALREVMLAHPDNECTVLCGHTHGEGEAQILPNLRVLTGGAEYGETRIQGVFDVV